MCIKFACLSYHSFRSFYMVGKSRFRSSERKVTSIASRFQPAVVAALKLRATSKDKSLPGFLTAGSIASIYVHRLKPIAYCWLYGIGIHFSPNNDLKSKARCGSDILGYKLTKFCKSCGRGKFVNTERSCQEKFSKIVKLVSNYKATLV